MGGSPKQRDGHQVNGGVDADLVAAQFDVHDSETHRQALAEALRARDVFRNLTQELQEKIALLERGLTGRKSQRVQDGEDPQLSFRLLAELLGVQGQDEAAAAEPVAQTVAQQGEIEAADANPTEDAPSDGNDGDDGGSQPHRRPRKRTGRKTASEYVRKVSIELVPEEVKALGTDAFVRIGEEKSTIVERQRSALVEVTIVRPKFRAKTDEAKAAVKDERAARGPLPEPEPEEWITVASPPDLPLERSIAGPGLLANLITRRFDDHLPYNRLENVYEREGMRLGRSTMFGWLDALRDSFRPLVQVMVKDGLQAPYVCVDATGVLMQAKGECKRTHFFVMVVPGRHVIFAHSQKHDAKAIDKLLGDYKGFIVADAHTIYDHLYSENGATEVACWGHARAYCFKALGSEPEIAHEFISNLRAMFLLERKFADKTRKQRERMRRDKVKLIVDRHFELCKKYEASALDGTPLAAAVRYSLNQEKALRRFLEDGRLPATNNISERGLRRQAVGRNNWVFLGSDDGAEVNTIFSTLIASCHMVGIEPEGYMRDVLCLINDWPRSRIIELAPCNWKQTSQQADTKRRLEAHTFRSIMLDIEGILHRHAG